MTINCPERDGGGLCDQAPIRLRSEKIEGRSLARRTCCQ